MVNIMTMDYGPVIHGRTMGSVAVAGAGTEKQLKSIFTAAPMRSCTR